MAKTKKKKTAATAAGTSKIKAAISISIMLATTVISVVSGSRNNDTKTAGMT